MDLPSLIAMLRAHQSADEQEATAVAAVLDLLDTYRLAALGRTHFVPGHLTASGFVEGERGVLLIHHDRLGRWMQPGGHFEPEDEGVEAAARREVEEETGIDGLESLGLLDVDVHEIPAGRGEPAHLHFDLRWGFEGRGVPRAGDGVVDAAWATAEELPVLGVDAGVERAVRRLLGRS